jgi:hypothetical protein
MGVVSNLKGKLNARSVAARLAVAELRRAEAESAYGALSLAAAEGDAIAARRLAVLEKKRASLVDECRRLRAAESEARQRETEAVKAEAARVHGEREAEVEARAAELRGLLAVIDDEAERLAARLIDYRRGVDALLALMQVERVDPAIPDLVTKVGANVRNTLAGRCPGLNPSAPFVMLGADGRPDIKHLKSAPEFPSGAFLIGLMRRLRAA